MVQGVGQAVVGEVAHGEVEGARVQLELHPGNRSRRSQRSSRGGYGSRSRSSRGRRSGSWGSRRRTRTVRTPSRVTSRRRTTSWGSRRRTGSIRTPTKISSRRRTSTVRTPSKTSGGWWGGRRTPKAKTSSSVSSRLDKIQTGLDIAGMTPGVGIVPDAVNAGIHAVRGNKVGVATSLGAMVPGAGQAVTATKLAAKTAKAAKSSGTKIDKLAGKATQSGKPYPRGKKTEVVKESKANYRQGKKAYKQSVVTDKTVKEGVRVGKTPDGRTVTLRKGQEGKGTSGQRGSSGSGKHGPTVEIKDNNGDITKVRLGGGKKGK